MLTAELSEVMTVGKLFLDINVSWQFVQDTEGIAIIPNNAINNPTMPLI